MKQNQFISEERSLKRGIDILMEKLGPVETSRFLSLPVEKRMESGRRHRLRQAELEKDSFLMRRSVMSSDPFQSAVSSS